MHLHHVVGKRRGAASLALLLLCGAVHLHLLVGEQVILEHLDILVLADGLRVLVEQAEVQEASGEDCAGGQETGEAARE